MIVNFVSSISASLLTKEVVFSGLAALGGAIVLRGLLLEWKSDKESEKEWYSNITDFRKGKHKSKRGEIWVIAGICVEIVVAVLFAALDVRDKYELNNQNAANDLHKQPIFALSGYATILLRPSGHPVEFDDETLSNVDVPPSLFRVRLPNSGNVDLSQVSLMFGRATEIENATDSGDAFISPDNVSESISTFGGEKLLRFDIYFGENQDSFQNAFLTPESLDAIDILLPTRGEMISGSVVISIDHDFIKRAFQIPKQTMFGESVSCVISNGTFAPLDWSPKIRADFEKSEEIRLKKADMQAEFLARGQELESIANGGKTERTISDEQERLFIDLLKDYPKMSIKVFVNSNDDEAVSYAQKIRKLLDTAEYNEEPGGFIKNSRTILIGTNQIPWQPSSNVLAFVVFPNTKYGLMLPVSIPFNDIKPKISIGLTNDPATYALGKLDCVKWAFSGIGINGIYVIDTNTLKAGEAGIFVPPKRSQAY